MSMELRKVQQHIKSKIEILGLHAKMCKVGQVGNLNTVGSHFASTRTPDNDIHGILSTLLCRFTYSLI